MVARRRISVAALVVLLLAFVPPWSPSPSHAAAPDWKAVDKLVDAQKLDSAVVEVGKIRDAAEKSGDETNWARALIRETQLRTQLGDYETAVRFLRERPWPKGTLARTALRLYLAATLVNYNGAYAWEIGQRERVASSATTDLKAWTRDQIFAAATAAYVEIWKTRDSLGGEPVARFGEYLTPNDYPAGVRGTLRDTVSYLFVELLANTQGWRPEQSSEIYALDLPALVKGDATRSRAIPLDDPAVHPLVKIGAVLDDLEAWHLQRKERDAALEARLTRLRALHAQVGEETDKAAVARELERSLPPFRDRPWWAMGQATLAGFVEQAGDLARARALAQAGAAAYPRTPGGERCRAIVARIEAPSYELAAMEADGVNRRSLQVTHQNLTALYLRAYAVDFEREIAGSRYYEVLPSGKRWLELLAGKNKPAAEWTVALPAAPDFRSHVTYVTPPLPKVGLYVIVASARAGFDGSDNLVKGTNFLATDLVLLSQRLSDGKIEAQLVEGEGGKPVAGASVRLERVNDDGGHAVDATSKTDGEGIVRFAPSSDRAHFMVARRGNSHALLATVDHWWRRPVQPDATRALVYTDRSIYRPLQKLYFKAIAFRGREQTARYNIVPDLPVTVLLRDPNGEEVARATAKTNAYGSVAGELVIPAGRLLGNWSVVAEGYGEAGVRVEEYKRPTFEVKLEDPRSALRLNSPAAIQGEARYYFGLPVTSGQVRWRVTREPVFPFWFWWGRGAWGGGFSPGARPQTVAAGSAALDAQGHFRFTFSPAADPRAAARGAEAREISYRYRVVADVTEEGGETRSAERGFRLGYVAVEATIKDDNAFFRDSERPEIHVSRADLDGVPRPGRGSWRLYALAQPRTCALPAEQPATLPAGGGAGDFHTAGDAQRPRWDSGVTREEILHGWSNGAERASGALVHDARGEAKVALPRLDAGAYRLVYETDDAFGAHYRTSKELFVAGVAGHATPLALPATLAVESSDVKVGGTARVFAGSCFAGQPISVDVWRDGQRVSHRRLTAGSDPSLIELPVRDDDRGGFTVSLTALRDFQLLTATAQVNVPWDDRELKVELSTFRDKIRPGAKEIWKVTVKGPPGAKPEAAAAELLAYMYDRSLDLFGSHTPPTPMSLWPTRKGVTRLQGSLGMTSASSFASSGWAARPAAPDLRGDVLKMPDVGYGGFQGVGGFGRGGGGPGGVKMRALAAPPMAAPAALMKREAQPQGLQGNLMSDKAAEPSGAGASPPPPAAAAVPLRANFSETAFWKPHLLAGADGTASIEFTVPDSVTSWNVWVHAVSKTLLSGSVHKETQSIKDLMVRPSVPRFLREGDRAELKVVVNNASARDLTGELRFALADPDTGQDLAREFGLSARDLTRPFKVAKGSGSNVTFALVAPRQVRLASIRVTAVAGDLSDGELRPLPVLPSRVHLVQSRFVSLHDKDRREMTFKDLGARDDTRINDQMVVTVDAQLFYTVLQALPYLVTYPYECAEQTLNRFLSAAIVGSVFRDYPAVATLARELSRRETPLETFDAADPNRRMALEESPWLGAARGDPLEKGSKSALVNVLNPSVAAAERASALAKLRKLQTANGAFPWFPGGPPDPYMTLYIMSGLARAAEFKVDVPKDVVQRGWQYLASYFRAQYAGKLIKRDCCWEWLTFLGYVASSYPDPGWVDGAISADERAQILDFSFKHWKQHSGYLKGLLALTLKRAGRAADARLVWGSVMDAAKTRPDEGTFWTREDRSWLWYNDTIETHAFALRTLMELSPADARKDGLVLWLLLNKKLNQWKSTRATAEVIYALVHYLKKEKALGVREAVKVTAAGKTTEMVFAPDVYTGKKNQIVVPGADLGPKTATVTVEKDSKGFAFASATWHFSTEQLPAEERGDFFSVTRRYFRRDGAGKEVTLAPLAEGAALKPGDEIEVQLSLRTKHAAEYVHLRDPRGAGFEPENAVSRYRWDLGIVWYEETRDSGANFFFEQLPPGEYTFKYRLRANMSGTFRVGPATVQSMYAPEFNAYSTGTTLTVAPATP